MQFIYFLFFFFNVPKFINRSENANLNEVKKNVFIAHFIMITNIWIFFLWRNFSLAHSVRHLGFSYYYFSDHCTSYSALYGMRYIRMNCLVLWKCTVAHNIRVYDNNTHKIPYDVTESLLSVYLMIFFCISILLTHLVLFCCFHHNYVFDPFFFPSFFNFFFFSISDTIFRNVLFNVHFSINWIAIKNTTIFV